MDDDSDHPWWGGGGRSSIRVTPVLKHQSPEAPVPRSTGPRHLAKLDLDAAR